MSKHSFSTDGDTNTIKITIDELLGRMKENNIKDFSINIIGTLVDKTEYQFDFKRPYKEDFLSKEDFPWSRLLDFCSVIEEHKGVQNNKHVQWLVDAKVDSKK